MAELTKITRGMQNGAETIDGNFKALNDELSTSTKALNDKLSTSTSDTLNIGNGLSIKFTKKGLGIVQAEFKGELSGLNSGKEMTGPGSTWVWQKYCPPETISLVGHLSGGNNSFHIDLKPTGRVVWWGPALSGSGAIPRGTVLYFVK